jgi:hypothetical protein
MNIKRDLAISRLGEFFHRTIEGELTQRSAQLAIGLREEIRRNCVTPRQIFSHSNLLCTLSGKEQCNFSRHTPIMEDQVACVKRVAATRIWRASVLVNLAASNLAIEGRCTCGGSL